MLRTSWQIVARRQLSIPMVELTGLFQLSDMRARLRSHRLLDRFERSLRQTGSKFGLPSAP
ncbi:MAG: hypothetical protein M3N35_02620 [Candidatus Binatota bacterium]|nr:hypothetical protein [Candidatus Binatota bacterium]